MCCLIKKKKVRVYPFMCFDLHASISRSLVSDLKIVDIFLQIKINSKSDSVCVYILNEGKAGGKENERIFHENQDSVLHCPIKKHSI